MNCLDCRTHLQYIAELSSPNAKDLKDKSLVYYCARCKTLYKIADFDTKMTIRGRVVYRRRDLQRAGFREVGFESRIAKRGASG